MKILTSILLLLCSITICISQYNYGLDVCNQDARIEGKLNIISGGNTPGEQSIFIGYNAGINDNKNNNSNVFIGAEAGEENVNGINNIFIGNKAGKNSQFRNSNVFIGSSVGINNNGNRNTYVGHLAGGTSSLSSENTLIGYAAGNSENIGGQNTFIGYSTGSNCQNCDSNISIGHEAGFGLNSGGKNIFIGFNAGNGIQTGENNVIIGTSAIPNNSNTSQTLMISSDNIVHPLLYGKFLTSKLGVNWPTSDPLPSTFSVKGTLYVSETAKLEPMGQPSLCSTASEVGLIYFDSTDDKVKVCTANSGWQDLN